MTAKRKDKKGGKRRGSTDQTHEQTKCSDYVTLEGSETSDSDRQPTPVERTEGATASHFLEVDRSKGAVPKSRSWAHPSTSHTDQSKTTDKSQGLKSNRTSPPKTRSQSKSPFRYGGRAFSSRPKSKSPRKGMGRFLSGSRSPTDKDPLVDFQDGVKSEEPTRRQQTQELKSDPSKRVKQEDLEYYQSKEQDDDLTSQSSISETSSVERATGAITIDESTDPSSEKSSPEEEEKVTMKGSVSAHAVLETKPGPSPRKRDRKK